MAVHCTVQAHRHSLPSNYRHEQAIAHQVVSSSFCSAQASEEVSSSLLFSLLLFSLVCFSTLGFHFSVCPLILFPFSRVSHFLCTYAYMCACIARIDTHAITLSQMEQETTMDNDGKYIEWLDEIDLQATYKDKPEQVKSVLEKAAQREHPTTGVPCMQLSQAINFMPRPLRWRLGPRGRPPPLRWPRQPNRAREPIN